MLMRHHKFQSGEFTTAFIEKDLDKLVKRAAKYQ
jgi:hypothetical protein